MGRNADRRKVAYGWISPDPAKVGPTLGVVVVIAVVQIMGIEFVLLGYTDGLLTALEA